MMKLKNILAVVAISAATAILSVWGYGKLYQTNYAGVQDSGKLPVNYAGFFGNNGGSAAPVDFTTAAGTATPAVVHIKTRTKAKQMANTQQRRSNPFGDLFGDDFFDDFFGGGPRIIPEQRASGSGVIITDDGFIVTNNHVVAGADEINVTLPNKKQYKASIIGTDPSTDLAVIKIEGKGFPYLVYGNSDDVKLGQWVLAVGYPLNLDVTVTAGIVSAKARSININERQSQTPVESFIQTDAAVNPGNSGGALINTTGELIGINSAIASPTGSYAGVSYAIPVNIAKKVITDIVKYGTVQRAFLGVSYPRETLDDRSEKELDNQFGSAWRTSEGVFLTDILASGAAEAAGLRKKDVITKINGVAVKTGPELQDQISRYKPGDKITITYKRDGKESSTSLTLKNKLGTTTVVKTETAFEKLGGEFETVDKKIAAANDIAGGVVVKKIGNGALKNSRMQEGFVITSINGNEIKNLDDLRNAIKDANGTVFFEGIYPGYAESYRYPIRLSEN
ncbi:MAG: trypsin-like peptidase domain-containing protein [Chitinophagaceae bacterium]|jgi:Do/DeqQ family serine protease